MSDVENRLFGVVAGLPIDFVAECLGEPRTRLVTGAFKDQPVVDPEAWVDELLRGAVVVDRARPPAPVNRKISRHLDDEPFLCIRSFEWRFPMLREELANLRRKAGWRGAIDLRVYASGPNGGLGLHTDERHAFVVQLAGVKYWTVSEEVENATNRRTVRRFTPFDEFVVVPGDLMFLPARLAHSTRSSVTSMACNIAFTPATS